MTDIPPGPAPSHDGQHAPAGMFSVRTQTFGRAQVLSVAGEVDLLTVAQLTREITRCLQGRLPVLVLDLTGVTFLGSEGLHALVEAQQASGPHTAVRVVADQRVVLRPILLTALDQVISIYGSVEQAVAAD
jgi:anti-sigma B factor antagonist